MITVFTTSKHCFGGASWLNSGIGPQTYHLKTWIATSGYPLILTIEVSCFNISLKYGTMVKLDLWQIRIMLIFDDFDGQLRICVPYIVSIVTINTTKKYRIYFYPSKLVLALHTFPWGICLEKKKTLVILDRSVVLVNQNTYILVQDLSQT